MWHGSAERLPHEPLAHGASIDVGNIVGNQHVNRLHRRMNELQREYAQVVEQEQVEEQQRGHPISSTLGPRHTLLAICRCRVADFGGRALAGECIVL